MSRQNGHDYCANHSSHARPVFMRGLAQRPVTKRRKVKQTKDRRAPAKGGAS